MSKPRLKRAATPTLRVCCNPYAALDHEGRPAGALLFDPVDHVAYSSDDEPRRFVGATLIVEEVTPASRYASATHDRGWDFSAEPVLVPATHYYRQHVATGDLFAADLDSWRTLGNDPRSFVDPRELLAAAKSRAITYREREYGPQSVPQETRDHWNERLAPPSPPSPAEEPTAPASPVALKSAGTGKARNADGGN